ncbi:VTT domain-containing protein [Candidatus Micrarchaeota archaeon]|nr:VTT domain-containing protein [Candidatus Micrarchaeota archaeon]
MVIEQIVAPYVWHINLFIATLLSASIVPLPSEPAIILTMKFLDPITVFIIAMLGSTLGSITNYYIGAKGIRNMIITRHDGYEKRAHELVDQYGFTMLLIFPWIPFVGDPILIVAGVLRMNFERFMTWIIIARAIKIIAIIMVGPPILDFLGI